MLTVLVSLFRVRCIDLIGFMALRIGANLASNFSSSFSSSFCSSFSSSFIPSLSSMRLLSALRSFLVSVMCSFNHLPTLSSTDTMAR